MFIVGNNTTAGSPIHKHLGYGETFIPNQGTIGVVGENGTKTFLLTAESGESHSIKPGEWHRFFNPSETEDVVFIGRVHPSHEGFEKTLCIFYGLAADGQGAADGLPKNMFYRLMVLNMSEMGLPGIRGWIIGTMATTAGWIGRILGTEERLTVKYYGRRVTDADRKMWKLD
jgi:hypothetical protein